MNSLNDMVDAYIECALWSLVDDDGEPMDATYYGRDDIDPASLCRMTMDCHRFRPSHPSRGRGRLVRGRVRP